MPELAIDSHGSYTLQLVVHDGYDLSLPDTVILNVGNVKPVAHAGADQPVTIGQSVTLDGSASTDADGDPLSYLWSLTARPADSTAQLSSTSTAITTIDIDAHGSYQLQLIVNDGFEDSEPDSLVLDVINVKPVANAGPDRSVYLNEIVTLDGTGSTDADGDDIGYHWSLLSKPAGSTASLVNATTVNPSLRIDRHGMYIVQLIVNDGLEESDADTAVLDVINVRPVADAGADQTVTKGSTFTLNGAGHDDDGDALTYQWSLLNRPAGSTATLNDAAAATPTFIADLVGVYIAQLIVDDGQLASVPDTVTVTAVNQAPVCGAAFAEPDALWAPDHSFSTITLQGVTDADNDPLMLTITGVTQDEPVDDIGDGSTAPDAIFDGASLQLRNERTGTSNGRVYQVSFTANDGSDSCSGSVIVTVPHDGTGVAVDDGQVYDSTLY